jgi:histidyl-tRNA synthetase
MKTIIQPVKGTRDFYPEEMALRNWLYANARSVSESFGYQEWDAPFLETIDLYAAKSGEELVKEQSFVFPDRSGDLITLRPELTPSLARMVAQRQRQLVYPLRWWSWGPFWRYEKPQKGRSREFFQWNVDMIGVDSPEADAELVAIAADFLRRCGLTPSQVQILVNNRRLMDSELDALGIAVENRPQVFHLIDRRDKMSPAEWRAFAESISLNDVQFSGVQAILANSDLWQRSEEVRRFMAAVRALGVSDYIRFAPHIIRGLQYYTGTVFECWDRDGEFRAILGGGRYDNLVRDVGGEPLSAVGFAMGDMVISLTLKKFNCLPENLGAPVARVLITIFDETSLTASFELAAELRRADLDVIVHPEAAKIGKQFKYGDRMGLKLALVIGPDEQANQQIAVKNLRTGEQSVYPRAGIAETVRMLLTKS